MEGRPSGYATIVDPASPLVERDTVQCCHCDRHIFVKPGTVGTVYLVFDRLLWQWREEAGASCWHCMKPVCLRCHDHGRCTPLEQRLRAMEGRRPQGLTIAV